MDLFILNADENYDKICGQILLTTKGRLAFYCALCGQYCSCQAFIKHLLERCSQRLDDDLKNCISEKSLMFSPQETLNFLTKKFQTHSQKICVVRQPTKHLDSVQSSQRTTHVKSKVLVQSIQKSSLNENESIQCQDSLRLSNSDCTLSEDIILSVTENYASSSEFEQNEEKPIIEAVNQEFKDEENCNEDDDQLYENFEYLEDEPFEDDNIQKNQLFDENADVETTDYCSQNNEEGKTDKSPKHMVDVVTVPLVVRNVKQRKKYFPSHIAPEERKYKCPVCGTAFKDRTNRNYHLRRHTNNKTHSCPDCGKKFYTSTEVKIHSRVHKKPELLFLCTKCGRSFESNFKLLNHHKRHTNQRDYICEVCKKGFFQLEGLKAHMAVHSAARPYTCEVCAATFKRPHILNSHMKQHLNKREYKCQYCEAAFNVQSGLYSHIKFRHKEYISTE